jgi:hypothetical protein
VRRYENERRKTKGEEWRDFECQDEEMRGGRILQKGILEHGVSWAWV